MDLNELADFANGREIEWSDVWTDQDLADATGASRRRSEEQEFGCDIKTVD